jgi:hypothetical protein
LTRRSVRQDLRVKGSSEGPTESEAGVEWNVWLPLDGGKEHEISTAPMPISQCRRTIETAPIIESVSVVSIALTDDLRSARCLRSVLTYKRRCTRYKVILPSDPNPENQYDGSASSRRT